MTQSSHTPLAKVWSTAILVLSLGACATDGSPTPPPSIAPNAADQAIESRIGTLPPQTLEDGACGMFLWARDSRRNLVFFTSDRSGAARFILDDRELELPRTAADGDLVFGQYTRQQFADSGVSLRVVVRPDPGSGLIGGAVLRQGMMNIRDGEGWSLVLPVAGMIACKGA